MMIDLLFRWLHIIPALMLVGGAAFMRISLAPALDKQSAEVQQSLLTTWRPAWAKVVMISSALLLVSGLFNAVRYIINYELPSTYHSMVALKLLLALVVFWLSAVLTGRSGTAEKFRGKMKFWLNVNLAFALLVVMLGGYMKMIDRQPKAPETMEPTAQVDYDR
jgi:uncharacterized membrane protein